MIVRFITVSLSYLFGIIASSTRPRWLARLFVKLYCLGFKIDLSVSKKKKFDSLQELFTREIDFEIGDDLFISPVEATLRATNRCSYQVQVYPKGACIEVGDLVGKQEVPINGSVYTFYLSPRNYHRVHMPFDAKVTGIKKIGGALWPLFDLFMVLRPRLFLENERVIFRIESDKFGLCYLVMVGAYNVGKVLVEKNGDLVSSVDCVKERMYRKGDLLGSFALGSAVVLITAEDFSLSYPRVKELEGCMINLGQPL